MSEIQDKNIAHEMALVEDEGRNEKPRGLIKRKFAELLDTVHPNQKLANAQERSEQVGEMMERQKELTKSAKERIVATIQNEGKKLEVQIVNREANSIIINTPDFRPVFQITYNLNKKSAEVHTFNGAQGPDKDYSIDREGDALRDAEEVIKNYGK